VATSTVDELSPEELEALRQIAVDPSEFVCPVCGKAFASENALNGHQAAHRTAGAKPASKARASRERPAPPKDKAARSAGAGLDAAAKNIVSKAVANTQSVGLLLFMVAPHLGLAIAGAKDPRTNQVVVRSRAEVAGQILLGNLAAASSAEELQRAAQIVELLRRYNAIFEYSALGDLAGSLAVAAAIDARLIQPDFRIKVGQLELPVVSMTIGDVVEELERQGMYQAAEPSDESSPPPSPPGEEFVEGGVENT